MSITSDAERTQNKMDQTDTPVPDANQAVVLQPTAQQVQRNPNGTLKKGGANLNPGGTPALKGRAHIVARTMHLMQKSVADVNYGMSRGQFESLSVADAIAYRRAHAAIYGGIDDVNFIVDRDEGPVAKITELTGKSGGPVAIATADVTELLLALGNKSSTPKEEQ